VEAGASSKQATKSRRLGRANTSTHERAGVDRLILALIANAYSEVTTTTTGQERDDLHDEVHPRVAIKAGIFRCSRQTELVQKRRKSAICWSWIMSITTKPVPSANATRARTRPARRLRDDRLDHAGRKPALLDTVSCVTRRWQSGTVKISELRDWLLARIH